MEGKETFRYKDIVLAKTTTSKGWIMKHDISLIQNIVNGPLKNNQQFVL
jgi:hypothetical protein